MESAGPFVGLFENFLTMRAQIQAQQRQKALDAAQRLYQEQQAKFEQQRIDIDRDRAQAYAKSLDTKAQIEEQRANDAMVRFWAGQQTKQDELALRRYLGDERFDLMRQQMQLRDTAARLGAARGLTGSVLSGGGTPGQALGLADQFLQIFGNRGNGGGQPATAPGNLLPPGPGPQSAAPTNAPPSPGQPTAEDQARAAQLSNMLASALLPHQAGASAVATPKALPPAPSVAAPPATGQASDFMHSALPLRAAQTGNQQALARLHGVNAQLAQSTLDAAKALKEAEVNLKKAQVGEVTARAGLARAHTKEIESLLPYRKNEILQRTAHYITMNKHLEIQNGVLTAQADHLRAETRKLDQEIGVAAKGPGGIAGYLQTSAGKALFRSAQEAAKTVTALDGAVQRSQDHVRKVKDDIARYLRALRDNAPAGDPILGGQKENPKADAGTYQAAGFALQELGPALQDANRELARVTNDRNAARAYSMKLNDALAPAFNVTRQDGTTEHKATRQLHDGAAQRLAPVTGTRPGGPSIPTVPGRHAAKKQDGGKKSDGGRVWRFNPKTGQAELVRP